MAALSYTTIQNLVHIIVEQQEGWYSLALAVDRETAETDDAELKESASLLVDAANKYEDRILGEHQRITFRPRPADAGGK